jgi:hypothetical protein
MAGPKPPVVPLSEAERQELQALADSGENDHSLWGT